MLFINLEQTIIQTNCGEPSRMYEIKKKFHLNFILKFEGNI